MKEFFTGFSLKIKNANTRMFAAIATIIGSTVAIIAVSAWAFSALTIWWAWLVVAIALILFIWLGMTLVQSYGLTAEEMAKIMIVFVFLQQVLDFIMTIVNITNSCKASR